MAHHDKADAEQDSVTLGLTGWRGRPHLMGRPHRHNEVELNFVERGAITYLFGGTPLTLTAGRLTLFWAAAPHRIVDLAPTTTLCWLTIPLAVFLHWRLPAALTDRVLYGRPVAEASGEATQPALDEVLVRRWLDDVRDAGDEGAERRRIALLEVEARLRRMALSLAAEAADAPDITAPVAGGTHTKAEGMAHFIAAHHARELSVADVARAVGLHPNYAMSVFRQAFGMSVVAYLTHYRIADAQRLLATTDLSVLDVAMESGFGSLSRFYAAFRALCGQTPRAYRATLRAPLTPAGSPGHKSRSVEREVTVDRSLANR